MSTASIPQAGSAKAQTADRAQATRLNSPLTPVRIALFCLLIFGFMAYALATWIFDKSKVSPHENRRYASFPHLKLSAQSIAAFPAGFESYFNDRFPLRFQLTTFSNLFKLRVFNVSGHPDVLIGKNGWLFFLNAGNQEFLRHDLLTPEKVQLLTSCFENRRRWLAMHHIRYLLVIAPCKCEMYREEIPSRYKLLRTDTMHDQLLDSLKKNSSVDVLDLRKQVLNEKNNIDVPLYWRTDTHWNELGAFVAYQGIANHLRGIFPCIQPTGWQDVNIFSRKMPGGDLARMLGLRDFLSDRVTMVKLRDKQWVFSSHPPVPDLNSDMGRHMPFATEVSNPALPRAYVIRDSFTTALQPFLSENFSRALFHWNHRRSVHDDFLTREILNEHPDIVIQELAENVLALGAIPNPAEVDSAVLNPPGNTQK